MVEDLTGKQFGLWTVLYRDAKKYKTRNARWICRCECGTIKSVFGKYLKNGKSISCGCSKKVDLTGQKFGKLTVLETLYDYNGYNRATYKCRCDCGEISYLIGNMNDRKSCVKCSHENQRKDYTGQKFGKLTVVEMLYNYKDNETYCRCECECGNVLTTRMGGLITGNTSSCGCIHSPSLLGNKYGKLTVIKELESDTPQRLWLCKCECGNKVQTHSHTLTSGHTQSCGCLRSESFSKFEVFITNILKENHILYKNEYGFDDCKGVGGKKLRFDFYLPNYNTLIEYDGEQHFKPIKYFGGEEAYQNRIKNDEIKNKYCKMHKINLIRIPYTLKEDSVEEIIINIIQSPVTTIAI